MTNAYEANQKTLGTAPIQLFTQSHPKREVLQHRRSSVRNMHGLAYVFFFEISFSINFDQFRFGKELTIGQYDVGEYTMDTQTTQRVWRRMKNLKSKIFNKANASDQENFHLFQKNRDSKRFDSFIK